MQWHFPAWGAALAAGLAWLPASASGQTPDDFFRDDNVQEIRLTVAPQDWQTLQEHYLEDTYYPAAFSWNGVDIARIGIKSRGSGSRTPIKPSLNLDFSRYVSSQRFLNMKAFILRNLSQDASMMHERLSLAMFARAGLPSLRSVHTRLYINGEYFGLFLAVEPIDKRFLVTRVGEDTGYLYQMQWTGTGYAFDYLGDDPALYVPELFEPKTHEDSPDAEHLVEMIRTINEVPDNQFEAAVSRYLDLGAFVSHVAVEQFLAEGDGVLGETGMTNFYFYRRAADSRFVFFVWDKDGTFSNWDWSIWHNTERNVLMRRALAVPALRQRYLDTLYAAAQAAEGEGGWFTSEVERIEAQIHQSAMEDPNRVCLVDGGSLGRCPTGEREKWVDWVRLFARARRDMVMQDLTAAGYTFPAPNSTLAPRSATMAAGAASASGASTVLAPGALAMLHVTLPVNPAWALALPLPTTLGGVSVEIGGVTAPLVSASSSNVEFQVPWELPCGPSAVRLVWQGQPGNWIPVEIRPASPAVFAVTHADGRLVSQAEPAIAGELLVAWANGLGTATAKVSSGAASPAITTLRNSLSITVGGRAAEVIWAGLAPGMVGLDQVVFRMPSGCTPGPNRPLSLIINGEQGVMGGLPVN